MTERHPIAIPPDDMSTEDKLRYAIEMLAQLWDQVWWLSLSAARRDAYRAEGYRDPIEHFYLEE